MVLLPDPFGPASAVIRPLGLLKLTPSTAFARAPVYETTKSCTAIMTSCAAARGKTVRRAAPLSHRVEARPVTRGYVLQDPPRLPAFRRSGRQRESVDDVLAGPLRGRYPGRRVR